MRKRENQVFSLHSFHKRGRQAGGKKRETGSVHRVSAVRIWVQSPLYPREWWPCQPFSRVCPSLCHLCDMWELNFVLVGIKMPFHISILKKVLWNEQYFLSVQGQAFRIVELHPSGQTPIQSWYEILLIFKKKNYFSFLSHIGNSSCVFFFISEIPIWKERETVSEGCQEERLLSFVKIRRGTKLKNNVLTLFLSPTLSREHFF